MSMERRSFVDRATRRVLPVLAVLGFALTACGEDKGTIPEQLHATVQDGGELCAERAKENADNAFPPVVVPDSPTAEQLQVALDQQTAIEQKKPEFQNQAYLDCVDENLVLVFEQEIIGITPTTLVTTTTEG